MKLIFSRYASVKLVSNVPISIVEHFALCLFMVCAGVSRLMDRLPLHEQSLSFCFIMSGLIEEAS